MESVLRAAAVYGFLLLIFRITGKRSLAQITSFDFILLLIVGESTQQALLGEDFSVINAVIVIATLMFMEMALSFMKAKWPRLDPILESLPLVVVVNGKVLDDRIAHERVDLDDILTAAREIHGLERLDQIKFAILERSGGISIVPASSE